LLNPQRSHPRTYHAQVEGEVTDEVLRLLRHGVRLKEFTTLPSEAARIEPEYPPREPPIRYRKAVPTSWIELTLTEGKNRQVRRMTAAVGFPTLRLIRVQIGGLQLSELGLAPGKWCVLTPDQQKRVLAK
jgi:23S rRNA pseudouridine2457 synthase